VQVEVTMFFESSFPANFRHLRTSHNITLLEMADFLELGSDAAIARIESKNSNPSFEILLKTAYLFAVSLDWLVGYPLSEQYTRGSVLAAEKYMAERQVELDHDGIMSQLMVTLNNQGILKPVSKPYPLEIRANLVFLWNVTVLYELQRFQSNQDPKALGKLAKFFLYNRKKDDEEKLKKSEARERERIQLYLDLRNEKRKSAVFKI